MTKEEKLQQITPTEWTACGLILAKGEKALTAKCPEQEIKWPYDAFVACHVDNHDSTVYSLHFFINFKTMQILPATVVCNVTYGKKYRIGEMVGKPFTISAIDDQLQIPNIEFMLIHFSSQDVMIHMIKLLQPKYEQWILETHLLGSETTDT